MKTLKALFVLALVAFFAAPAFAETQNVKVSGSIDAYWFYRNDFDLTKNNDAGSLNTLTGETLSNPSTNHRTDSESYFMSITQIQVAADMTNNVSTVINLVNQRDWNADTFGTAGTSGTAAETSNNEFDVTLDLAYVQLKEAFYSPLTLTIGRQDLSFGRGFIIGWNPQDPQNTIQAEEYTAIQSFDAIRATLDFNPWTIDVVYSKILENATNSEDDKDLWITNVNYKFSEYNAVAEGIFVAELDKAALSSTSGTFNNDTYTIGGRVQFDPISQITLGGEVAYQFGDYRSALGGAGSTRDRDAWALDLFGTYRFDNAWKPEATLEYVHMGGESDLRATSTASYGAWNNAYRGPTYGRIHEYLETYNTTIFPSDQSSGQNLDLISLTGSLKPMDDLMLSLTWYYFWTPEDAHSTITNPNSSTLNDNIGNEFDTTVTYAYTEDVTFLVYADWFIPGDFYNSPNDSVATEVVSGVKVVF